MSSGPALLAAQCVAAHLPAPILELRFHPVRRWRIDLTWPDQMLAVEIEGGAWLPGGGRHNRGQGYLNDLVKYNEITLAGWRLLRFSPDQILNGYALQTIERALAR